MANRKILLIEPSYKNKYPPLGLMKIAAYHGPYGKKDQVKFVKGETDKSVFEQAWDRIYVTTLFSFEWKTIAKSIEFALKAAQGNANTVFVGGIAASLMHEAFQAEPQWRGIRFIKGLLTDPPAIALQLDEFSEELYADDRTGRAIEDLTPDYSILDQIDYRYPVRDGYFAYASRGCIRKCHFCGVPKLEGAQRDAQSITEVVRSIDERYGPKKDLILMDNNVVASARFKEIIAEIRGLGFVPGAKLSRPGKVPVQRRVDFNQGVDARILCKDPMYLREMSTIALKPLRIAFDHIGVRKPYEQAIHFAHESGLHDLSNYMLYNFHDSPEDLYERMFLNLQLNEKLGIRIFSFPMRYQPTTMKDRSHVGENWTRYFLRSMQIILQATHGIVSGSPTFFKRAFGGSYTDFMELLHWPNHFLLNRAWYEELDGRAELDQYRIDLARLTDGERAELIALLSTVTPSGVKDLHKQTESRAVASILKYYEPLPDAVEVEIWRLSKLHRKGKKEVELQVPEDELVEDAGLQEAA